MHAPSRFDVVIDVALVRLAGGVPQVGQLLGHVSLQQSSESRDLGFRVIRVDGQLSLFDLSPGTRLGLEVRNRAKFKSAFPVSAFWQPFPPPVDEYVAARSLFAFDPAVLERVSCTPQHGSAPFVVAARIVLSRRAYSGTEQSVQL
jgi:hypothetical protein